MSQLVGNQTFIRGFLCTGPQDQETGANPGFEFLCDVPGTSIDGYLNTGYISCMEDEGALDLGACSGPAHYGCPSSSDNAGTEQGGGGGVKRTEKSSLMVFCALASCLSLVTSFS